MTRAVKQTDFRATDRLALISKLMEVDSGSVAGRSAINIANLDRETEHACKCCDLNL